LCGGVNPSAQVKQEVIPVRTKRAYRAKEINAVSVSQIVAGRQGDRATVGIDIGKTGVFVMLRWADGKFAGPWHAENIREIRVIVEFLTTLASERELIVAMEPTGRYGDALRYALTQAGLNVHRVQGKASHDYAEIFDGVPSQHDRKDAAVVAELAALGKSAPWPYDAESVENQERTYWVQRLETAQETGQMWMGRLEALLARHWPEVTKLLKLNSISLLKTLAHYGGPEELAADAGAAEQLAGWGRTLLTPEKIQALVESAAETVGVPEGDYERQWLRDCANQILAVRRTKQQAKRELKRLEEGKPVLSRLAAAVGYATASVLWVYLGSPRGYHCGEAYRKAMGLNLKERSSGKCRGQLRITKRGPGAVRRWLYLAAMRSLREKTVREWFEAKKTKDGDRGGKALVGVMRKLAVALYRVAVDDVAFDAAKLFPGKPLPQVKASARARQKGPPLRASAVTSSREGRGPRRRRRRKGLGATPLAGE
jgi:transposase